MKNLFDSNREDSNETTRQICSVCSQSAFEEPIEPIDCSGNCLGGCFQICDGCVGNCINSCTNNCDGFLKWLFGKD